MTKSLKTICASLLSFALALTVLLTLAPEEVYALTSDVPIPLWDSAEHRNPNPQARQTSGAVRQAMEDFHSRHWRGNRNPWPFNWQIPQWTANDERMSQEFWQVLFDAAAQDPFLQTMPFNQAFFELLLINHRHYFAHFPQHDFIEYSGFYTSGNRSMFTALFDPHGGPEEWANAAFAHVAIHEVAHALGLGESLAHLFDETFMGVNYARVAGAWYRDSGFDRALLNIVGPVEFWRAALSSTEAYAQLWNRYMSHIASFEDMQLARQAVLQIQQNESLAAQFRRYAGISETTMVDQLQVQGHWADQGHWYTQGHYTRQWVQVLHGHYVSFGGHWEDRGHFETRQHREYNAHAVDRGFWETQVSYTVQGRWESVGGWVHYYRMEQRWNDDIGWYTVEVPSQAWMYETVWIEESVRHEELVWVQEWETVRDYWYWEEQIWVPNHVWVDEPVWIEQWIWEEQLVRVYHPVWIQNWVWVESHVVVNTPVDTLFHIFQAVPASVGGTGQAQHRQFERDPSELISQLARFARRHNMYPIWAFFDGIIDSHRGWDGWHFPSQEIYQERPDANDNFWWDDFEVGDFYHDNTHEEVLHLRGELRLWEGMGPIGGADTPFIWYSVPNTRNRVGLISLRAFAYFIGDSNPVWDGDIRMATTSGFDAYGNWVTVEVVQGSAVANIVVNDVVWQVDIATATDFLSGPAGTVVPVFINNRIYLPLRFVAEVFGFTVTAEGSDVVVR